MRLRKTALIASFAAALALSACAGDPDTVKPALHSSAKVDLQRYMGRWYIIANIPYFAESGKVMTRDEYTLRADGMIDNNYVFRRSFDGKDDVWHGVATVVPGTGNAQWSVRFWGVMNADYLVLDVAPDYSWALVGHPQRKDYPLGGERVQFPGGKLGPAVSEVPVQHPGESFTGPTADRQGENRPR